jgi:hypothetical protein
MDTPLPIRSGCDAVSDPPMTSVRKRNGFTVVRIVLGILLQIAAGLKLADESLGSIGVFGPFASPLWRLGIIEAEALLGVWLLIGAAPRILWLVAMLFFSALASVSLFLGIEGQPSCGCFGTQLPVRPWYSFALDLASVAALLWGGPSRGQRIDAFSHSARVRLLLAVAAGLGVILAVVFSGLTWMYGPAQLTKDGVIVGDGNVVILEPQQWVGIRCPLLPYIEDVSQSVKGGQRPLRERLAEGEWYVVLYRSSCPRCREMLDHYRQIVEQDSHGPKPSISVAIVAIPPDISASMPDWCEMGKLGDGYRWFLKAPTAVHLRNGVVEPGKDDASDVEVEPSIVQKLW